jgi:hypothetical protein
LFEFLLPIPREFNHDSAANMSSDENNVSTTVEKKPEHGGVDDEIIASVDGGLQINAAGHRDQLKRQYNLWALAGIALTVDNAWAALGSSISVSIGKGHQAPPASKSLIHDVNCFAKRNVANRLLDLQPMADSLVLSTGLSLPSSTIHSLA